MNRSSADTRRNDEQLRTVRKRVVCREELDGQDSPVLVVMEYYGAEMTREEYIQTNYLGEVGPDTAIPAEVEETFPEQFRRSTLLETAAASAKLQ